MECKITFTKHLYKDDNVKMFSKRKLNKFTFLKTNINTA